MGFPHGETPPNLPSSPAAASRDDPQLHCRMSTFGLVMNLRQEITKGDFLKKLMLVLFNPKSVPKAGYQNFSF